jgi:2-polyprenyl-3-methyl-5-hydroxy-6-metoxy-1,4-benzoquinol methylase
MASYLPLDSIPGAGKLPARSWPPAVEALLAQQVTQPAIEKALRDAMPRLTPIAGEVSLSVQRQYEENPYPKWVLLPPSAPLDLDAYLGQLFARAPFRPLGKGGGIDMLIAGCGTGQESIDVARQFPGARVLAVDLSLASLGYAARKAGEIGVKNVEHAQGDVMELASLGRTFDVISSVGVLHHLAQPLQGWRELVSILRPGGVMLVGLYSEHARRGVVAAREFIAARGYGSTAAEIRRARQDLLACGEHGEVTSLRDFFGTNECRDLLFHVQEHRFTLPKVKEMLGALGLDFLGFVLEPASQAKYRQRFPQDIAAADLERWNEFEREFPQTFAGMYVFWVQKRSE